MNVNNFGDGNEMALTQSLSFIIPHTSISRRPSQPHSQLPASALHSIPLNPIVPDRGRDLPSSSLHSPAEDGIDAQNRTNQNHRKNYLHQPPHRARLHARNRPAAVEVTRQRSRRDGGTDGVAVQMGGACMRLQLPVLDSGACVWSEGAGEGAVDRAGVQSAGRR